MTSVALDASDGGLSLSPDDYASAHGGDEGRDKGVAGLAWSIDGKWAYRHDWPLSGLEKAAAKVPHRCLGNGVSQCWPRILVLAKSNRSRKQLTRLESKRVIHVHQMGSETRLKIDSKKICGRCLVVPMEKKKQHGNHNN